LVQRRKNNLLLMKAIPLNINSASSFLSVTVHLIVILILFLFNISPQPEEDLIQISYGEPGGGSGGYGSIADQNQFVSKPETPSEVKEEEKGENPPESSTNSKTEIEKIILNKMKTSVKKETNPLTGTAKPAGTNKEGKGIGNGTGAGSGTGNGNGNGLGNGLGDGFGIDWGGAVRKIYYYYVPGYPDGVVKEIDVKLKFKIESDGSVSNITVLRKADAVLERVAVEALKLWRFEPLPKKAEPMAQTAIITFPFRLD
jgi:periplasmic protein TonB